jgi:hypothetical protein
MDTLMTFMIVGIIGLSVLPFLLLSGALGARRKGEEAGDGPIVPLPAAKDGGPLHMNRADSHDGGDSGDDGGDGDVDGDDADDLHHLH